MVRNRKHKDILTFALVVLLVVVANVIFQYKFFRIDLTADKRFSIAEGTIDVVQSLEDELEVTVYLHGKFPAKFSKLEDAVKETLDELRAYSSQISYEFIDPNEALNDSVRGVRFRTIMQQGLQPISLKENEGANSSELFVFPGAILKYKNRSYAINFIKGAEMSSPEERISRSISELEYEFASAIKAISQTKKKRISLIEGHGEIPANVLSDLLNELGKSYDITILNLASISKIEGVDAIVVAQPTQAYTEADKAKIDQFVLNGGKAVFCIDALEVRKDSIGMQALPYKLNLTDMFFTYGFRINENMVQDLTAAPVRVNTGSEYKMLPWSFHPLISSFSDHVITKGFDGAAVYTRYINTIDTIRTKTNVIKTPLMFTSNYCRVKSQPVVYSAEELRIYLDKRYYPDANLPVAYLLEGEFKSLYKGRKLPDGVMVDKKKDFGKSAILVVSDGDFLIPEVQEKTGRPYPLGYNPLLGQTFMNKALMKNSIDYLLGESSISNLRAKQVDFRPLDKFKVKEEKLKWQIINIVIPIFIVIVFGLLRFVLRKKKYASF